MKVTVNLPENIALKEYDLVVYISSKLYEDGIIAAGQGAEMAGLSKRAFIEIIGKYGVSLFSESEDDLLNDIQNA
jgi:predicted HTH domain antitoxin